MTVTAEKRKKVGFLFLLFVALADEIVLRRNVLTKTAPKFMCNEKKNIIFFVTAFWFLIQRFMLMVGAFFDVD